MSSILKYCQDIPVRTVEPGTVLFTEGTQSRKLCILVDGKVDILVGGFLVNTVSEQGAVFGEMSILLDSPHTATVQAHQSCLVHVIEDGDTFLRSNKDMAYDLLKMVASQLQGLTSHLTDLNRFNRGI